MLININTMLILLWHGHYANYQPNSEAFFFYCHKLIIAYFYLTAALLVFTLHSSISTHNERSKLSSDLEEKSTGLKQ